MSRILSARVRKSLADVTRRKGRTLLVVVGIFIGVFGLTAINVAEETLFSAVVYSSGIYASRPDIFLHVDRTDPALLPQLRAVPNVALLDEETIYSTQWHVSAAPGHTPLDIFAYPDLQSVAIDPPQLLSGRWPAVGEIALLSGDLAIQSAPIGAAITVDTPSGTANLTISGIARQEGQTLAASGTPRGFMSEAGLEQMAGAADSSLAHLVAAKVHNDGIGAAGATAKALARVLQAGGVQVLDSQTGESSVSQAAQLANDKRIITAIFTVLRVLIGLAVALSAFLILNTIATLITEQAAVIGTLKALGGTRGVIMRGYLTTVAIYSVLATMPGIALGMLAGNALAGAIAPQIPLALGPFALDPALLLPSALVGLGVPLLAALLPLWNGTRITVREAVSTYGIASAGQSGNQGAWARRLAGWGTQTARLGLRSVFRKRWRAALTLVTLTIAWVCFLVAQISVSSLNDTIAATYAHLDADVDVSSDSKLPLAQTEALVAAQPNVAAVERFEPAGLDTHWGSLDLSAFDPDTRLYHYHLTGGRWFRPGETNAVLLNADAANRTGLHVGDILQVAYGSRHATWTVIGTLDETTGGSGHFGGGVTTVDSLLALFGVPAAQQASYGDRFMVQARDRSPQAVDQLATRLDGLFGGQSGGSGGAEAFHAELQRHVSSFYTLYFLLYAVVLIIGLAGLLGLANALATSVLERRREIGMLRAMGASSWRVAQVFWVEGMALGTMAWVCGVALGVPLAYAFVQIFSQMVQAVDFTLHPLAFGIMLVAVLLVATLASVAPARRAARVRVAEMLRYE